MSVIECQTTGCGHPKDKHAMKMGFCTVGSYRENGRGKATIAIPPELRIQRGDKTERIPNPDYNACKCRWFR